MDVSARQFRLNSGKVAPGLLYLRAMPIHHLGLLFKWEHLGTNREEYLLLDQNGHLWFRRFTRSRRVAWSGSHGRFLLQDDILSLQGFHCCGNEVPASQRLDLLFKWDARQGYLEDTRAQRRLHPLEIFHVDVVLTLDDLELAGLAEDQGAAEAAGPDGWLAALQDWQLVDFPALEDQDQQGWEVVDQPELEDV